MSFSIMEISTGAEIPAPLDSMQEMVVVTLHLFNHFFLTSVEVALMVAAS